MPIKVFVKRDPDANLNTYDEVEAQFDSFSPPTVKQAVERVMDEIDLSPSDTARMVLFVNGMQATADKVLEDGDKVYLKENSKDNG